MRVAILSVGLALALGAALPAHGQVPKGGWRCDIFGADTNFYIVPGSERRSGDVGYSVKVLVQDRLENLQPDSFRDRPAFYLPATARQREQLIIGGSGLVSLNINPADADRPDEVGEGDWISVERVEGQLTGTCRRDVSLKINERDANVFSAGKIAK